MRGPGFQSKIILFFKTSRGQIATLGRIYKYEQISKATLKTDALLYIPASTRRDFTDKYRNLTFCGSVQCAIFFLWR